MLKRLAGATVIVVLLLTVLEASAVEDEANRLANNFSHENLICAVYNSLVAQCIESRDSNDPRKLPSELDDVRRPILKNGPSNWPLRKGVGGQIRDRPTRYVVAREEFGSD